MIAPVGWRSRSRFLHPRNLSSQTCAASQTVDGGACFAATVLRQRERPGHAAGVGLHRLHHPMLNEIYELKARFKKSV